MANIPENIPPLGNMDLDSDIVRVKEGDYGYSEGITFVTDEGRTSISAQNILGNTLSFDLGEAFPQTKRIFIPLSAGLSAQSVGVFRSNGSPWFNFVFLQGASIALTAANFINAFNIAIAAATPSFIASFGVVANGVEVELNQNGLDWSFYVDSIKGTTIREAYVNGGKFKPVASNEKLGDLFVISCITDNPPTEYALIGANNVGVQASFTIASSPLVAGQYYSVYLTGTTVALVDGAWMGLAISTNTMILIGSQFVASSLGGSVLIGTEAIGQFGVAQKNLSGGLWGYTRLLQAKGLNIITKKQPDFRVSEINALKQSHYWTDNYNEPKCFNYTGAYVLDGAINYVNPLGVYDYDTLAEETNLQVTQVKAKIEFISQNQSGGGIKAGNHRYTARFVTSEKNKSEILLPTGLVEVYSSGFGGNPTNIFGNKVGEATTKANVLKISGFTEGVYDYVELIDILYENLNPVASYVNRYQLLPDQTEITIVHTGLETGSFNLDAGELEYITAKYKTALSMCSVDNRCVLSNLTTYPEIDFTEWFKTWNHSVVRKTISDIGTLFNTDIDAKYVTSQTTGVPQSAFNPSTDNIVAGEYQDPNIAYMDRSLMVNDVYRFVAVPEYFWGTLGKAYWIDDIAITTWATNNDASNNPVTLPNRRVGSVPDLDLCQRSTVTIPTPSGDVPEWSFKPYVYGVEFSGFDVNEIIDGKPVKEWVKKIHIFRADRIPEILASGIFTGAIAGFKLSPNADVSPQNGFAFEYFQMTGGWPDFAATPPSLTATLHDYPQVPTGVAEANLDGPNNNINFSGLGCFYCPDHELLGDNIGTILNNDTIINFGPPQQIPILHETGSAADGFIFPCSLNEFGANYTPQDNSTIQLVTIKEGDYVTQGGTRFFNPFWNFTKSIKYSSGTDFINVQTPSSWVFGLNAPLLFGPNGANASTGVFSVQYYRPKTYNPLLPFSNKYGNLNSVPYYYTGVTLDLSGIVTSNFPTGILQVYSGDVHNQKYFHKIYTPVQSSFSVPVVGPPKLDYVGSGGGLCYFASNNANARMVQKVNSSQEDQFPSVSIARWLGSAFFDTPSYDRTYNFQTLIKGIVAFNGEGLTANLPVRIAYSLLKIQNGLFDGYRAFLPLDFRDLELSFGAVVNHYNLNGELFSRQWRKVMRQYFNTRGELQVTSQDTAIVIGDGSVLARPGQTITAYGGPNKWADAQGKNQDGNDVVYWIDTERGIMFRAAQDGVRAVSIENRMMSFFQNNTYWANQFDIPAYGYGTHGTWLDKKYSVLFTARAYDKSKELWNVGDFYQVGSLTWLGTSVTQGFDEMPTFYECIQANNGSSTNKPNTGSDWQQYWKVVPLNDNRCYNLWTIEFNELKNGYTSFQPFHPKIYMNWLKTYLTGNPQQGLSSLVYEHETGIRGSWYNGGIVKDAYIRLLFSKDSAMVKHFLAFMVNSFILPKRVDIYTKNTQTFMLDTDFTTEENMYFAPIKNDILTSSTGQANDQDTSGIWGQYIEIVFTFEAGRLQYLTDFVVKFKPNARLKRS